MDNVQNNDSYTNVPPSQTYRSYYSKEYRSIDGDAGDITIIYIIIIIVSSSSRSLFTNESVAISDYRNERSSWHLHNSPAR
jgi:hypothetical protein